VSGVPSATDGDGDGIADAMDNCPKIFNPPFDGATAQDDADGDGIGDVCDPDPCKKADGSDACPVGTPPPPPPPPTVTTLTIPEMRDPTSVKKPADKAMVKVESAIVTAVKTSGTSHAFTIQDPTASTYAGVYVFIGSAAPTVAIGDTVTVTGSFYTYRALDELDVTATGGTYMKLGTGTVPDPVVVLPSDIITGGPKAKTHQSMLVKVNGVTAKTALVTSGSVGTFTLDPSGLVITDLFAGSGAFTAAAGDMFTSITGVVYAFGPTSGGDDSRLAPRSGTDVAK
jgi:hypothetical protein